jgi:hypothetical protein
MAGICNGICGGCEKPFLKDPSAFTFSIQIDYNKKSYKQ